MEFSVPVTDNQIYVCLDAQTDHVNEFHLFQGQDIFSTINFNVNHRSNHRFFSCVDGSISMKDGFNPCQYP